MTLRCRPVNPKLSHGRFIQQSACFTYHPPECEDVPEDHLWRIEIPAAAKPSILEELQVCGVRRATLFPDLDNLARDLRMGVLLERLET